MDRRRVLRYLATIAASAALRPLGVLGADTQPLLTRPIPSSGERIPLVGLGSWITFNVGDDPSARDECTAVIRAFLESGGKLIDSSPMYGSSQEVIGYALQKLGRPRIFAATKVWTSSAGAAQIEEQRLRSASPVRRQPFCLPPACSLIDPAAGAAQPLEFPAQRLHNAGQPHALSLLPR